jgi:hypothetical protein
VEGFRTVPGEQERQAYGLVVIQEAQPAIHGRHDPFPF